MRIVRIDWDDRRVEHIARHHVECDEVLEACRDPLHMAHREGANRYRLYGQTADGRWLFVVLEQAEHGVFTLVTARDMTEGEKSNFRRLRR